MATLGGATLVALLASALTSTPAQATPIGPSCGTCQGSIYELSYTGTPVATTATTETWEITYTIDTSGYDGGGSFLDVVAVKVSGQLVSAKLMDAPGGVGNWLEFMGGLNSGGCSGAGEGFDCVRAVSLAGAPTVPDGVYTWVFHLEMETGGLFVDLGEASVKARYVSGPSRHKIGALVSENITLTLVPEPSTAALVGLGASILAGRRRR